MNMNEFQFLANLFVVVLIFSDWTDLIGIGMIMLGLYECLDHSWSKGYFPVVHLFPFSVLRDNSEYEFKLLAKYDFDCIAFF